MNKTSARLVAGVLLLVTALVPFASTPFAAERPAAAALADSAFARAKHNAEPCAGRLGSGKSFNAWNADLGCWQQNWMDDSGDVTNYTDGHFVDGAMRFAAEKKDGKGRWQKHRLTFFALGPDQVRQLGEHSDDGGVTWTVDYDLDYRRVK